MIFVPLPTREHLTMFEDAFGCHNWSGMLLALSGTQPGVLLKSCGAQQTITWLSMSEVPRLRNPAEPSLQSI